MDATAPSADHAAVVMSVHEDAAASDVEPAGHADAALEPSGQKEPAGHAFVVAACEPAEQKLPAGHALAADGATAVKAAEQKKPPGQVVHADAVPVPARE